MKTFKEFVTELSKDSMFTLKHSSQDSFKDHEVKQNKFLRTKIQNKLRRNV